jgi:multidrug efflux pump subunit AcrB
MLILGLILLSGCGSSPRAVTRITVSCPYISPRQSESRIAIPLELALAGLPRVEQVVSFSRAGRVEIYLVHDSRFSPALLRSPLDRVVPQLPPLCEPPMIETLATATVPAVERGDADVVEVEPNSVALERHGVSEESLWKAVIAAYVAADDADARVKALQSTKVATDTEEIPITTIAAVEIAPQPRCIVRRNGVRL